ncbi:hypothetical protein [Candidatus Ichthyocystis hellenicum]|uniref:hypothetical protein n=1 Tax=Candidatus Ichthyocystis hellenicum TaxID=1561003 RepID=UPI000B8242F2|nr:hypothetical protein [Candidatus Ichthyocystis hellenicum]
MSRVEESSQYVGASCSLSEECGHTAVLYQEDVGNLDAIPSCSNNGSGYNKLPGSGVVVVNRSIFYNYSQDRRLSSELGKLISRVFVDFTSRNVCEDRYKQKDFFLSRLSDAGNYVVEGAVGGEGDPRLEEVADIVLRVAVSVVVGIDEGCDFLLTSSDRVRKYFVACLGSFDIRSAVYRFLGSAVRGFKYIFSDEASKKETPSAVVCLLKDVATGCSFLSGNYYEDVESRASLDPEIVGLFLKSVIVLLILFPEALHPAIVRNEELNEENLYKFFSPEGRCCLKLSFEDDIIDSDDLGGWEDNASSSDESCSAES